MNFTKILTFAIIAMFLLVPFASAKQEVADNLKQDKKTDEKVTDKTKESAKEISNKDKDIKGKVSVTDSDTGKYTVEKKSKTEISISKDEAKGEHTKSKVAISETDLKTIDIDKDGKFGVIRKSDSGEILDVYTATTSQLVSGVEMTFSTNIVNGYSGTYTKTGSSQNVSPSFALGQSFNSTKTSAVSLNISTTAYSDPYSEIAALNPVAWYKFDSASGTKIVDSSGNGKTATAYNGMTWGTGKYNNAGIFDNINDYAQLPSGLISDVYKSKYTIVMHFYPQNTTGIHRYIDYTANHTLGATIINGKMIFATCLSGVYSNKQQIAISANKHYCMIIIGNGNGTATAYLNNVQLSSSSLTPSLGFLSQLSTAAPTSRQMDGKISNLLFFNTDLNSTIQTMLLYDNPQQLQARTNANSTYSGYWNSSSNNPLTLPVSSSDGLISSIQFKVPVNVTQNGVNIYDYNQTVAPFTPSGTVYFTKDTTLVSETAGDVYFNVSISHTSSNTANSGTIEHPLNSAHAYNSDPTLVSTNPNATVANNGTYLIISTGYVPSGQTYTYNVSISQMEGLYLGFLQQWNGLLQKWGFVSTGPTLADRNTYIGDEIEVTVS